MRIAAAQRRYRSGLLPARRGRGDNRASYRDAIAKSTAMISARDVATARRERILSRSDACLARPRRPDNSTGPEAGLNIEQEISAGEAHRRYGKVHSPLVRGACRAFGNATARPRFKVDSRERDDYLYTVGVFVDRRPPVVHLLLFFSFASSSLATPSRSPKP